MTSRSPSKALLTASRRAAACLAASLSSTAAGLRGAQSSATNARNSSVVGRARFSGFFCSSLTSTSCHDGMPRRSLPGAAPGSAVGEEGEHGLLGSSAATLGAPVPLEVHRDRAARLVLVDDAGVDVGVLRDGRGVAEVARDLGDGGLDRPLPRGLGV